jgi:hypothetical protein
MKRAITTSAGLVALVATLVLGTCSGSASALSLFLARGGPLPTLVLVLNDNTQIFTPVPGGFAIECQHFIGHGLGPKGRMSGVLQIITGTYHRCTALGVAASVTPVEYEITPTGEVNVLKPITITVPAAGCSIKVNSGGANEALLQVLFLNRPGGDILVHAEIKGINSLASGEPCGPAGVEKTQGTYFGLVLAWADGGASIDWQA